MIEAAKIILAALVVVIIMLFTAAIMGRSREPFKRRRVRSQAWPWPPAAMLARIRAMQAEAAQEQLQKQQALDAIARIQKEKEQEELARIQMKKAQDELLRRQWEQAKKEKALLLEMQRIHNQCPR